MITAAASFEGVQKAPSPSFDDLRDQVDARLEAFLGERSTALPEAGDLIASIRRVIEAGGKRLRPAFCYWGYRAAGGGHGTEIVSVAAALELLHTFAIVHDDIMDAAPKRRGRPTVVAQHGIEEALLVGDLALVLADELFMSSGFAPDAIARGFRCYSRMRQEVIAGQYLDLKATRDPEIDEATARRIAVLKSGRYSVEEPLAIGATLAGADKGFLGALSAFAAPLGEAFQLRDDLLGTFGAAAETGKPTDSDIRQGKRNIVFARTIAGLQGDERAWFVSRWGAGDLTEVEVERLRSLADAGARRPIETLLHELKHSATTTLGALDCEHDARAALGELQALAIDRES